LPAVTTRIGARVADFEFDLGLIEGESDNPALQMKYQTPGIDAFLGLCREASADARGSDDMVP
jgi:hypothetical protein